MVMEMEVIATVETLTMIGMDTLTRQTPRMTGTMVQRCILTPPNVLGQAKDRQGLPCLEEAGEDGLQIQGSQHSPYSVERRTKSPIIHGGAM